MRIKVTVDGQEYEVEVEVAESEPASGPPNSRTASSNVPTSRPPAPTAALTPSQEPAADEAKVVRSPLAGVVSKVECEAGQQIKAEQEILVLEAMKMFTTITSSRDGTIKSVAVGPTDSVKQGQILVEFE